MIIPPHLIPGNTIGIMCPSGYMPFEKMAACIDRLKSWGLHVQLGSTTNNQFHYFSGTDEQRLTDLQEMLDNPAINAVLFGRGGYGLSRIIDRIDFKLFNDNPKWLIGYSDITLMHNHLTANSSVVSLHAPMAAAFIDATDNSVYLQSIRNLLFGEAVYYDIATHPFNRTGTATGILTGGNLAMLVHSIGSISEVETKGKILFIEDVGEYIYNVDRMLIQLKRAGKLKQLAGLIVGSFTDVNDTTIPFGKTIYDCISEHVSEYNYPVCFGFPVGHVAENYALQCGRQHTLHISKDSVSFYFE